MRIKETSGWGHVFSPDKRRPVLLLAFWVLTLLLAVFAGAYMQRARVWTNHLKPLLYGYLLNGTSFLESLTVTPEQFAINIKQKDFLKIAYKRQEAIRRKRLIYKETDWVPAELKHRSETYKIKIRLKGTLGAHWLDDEVWSYKIKVRDNKTILGMKRFALQSPSTRDYMNEWYLHRFLKHIGLIGLRYEFLELTLNGKKMPIYALEENFEKRLLENNGRREGPIFQTFMDYIHGPAKPVKVYQESKYSSRPQFKKLVTQAENLIEGYRQGNLPLSKVFDLDELALAFAAMDVFGYYHCLYEDNMRFYLEPVSGRVQPVLYDNEVIASLEYNRVRGSGKAFLDTPGPDGNFRPDATVRWPDNPFSDIDFFERYIEKLELLSEEGFITGFYAATQADADRTLSILHRSYPSYRFDGRKIMNNNIMKIRRVLDSESLVMAYFEGAGKEAGTFRLQMANQHTLPVEIKKLKLHGKDFIPKTRMVLQAKKLDGNMEYKSYEFRKPPGMDLSEIDPSRIEIVSHILGGKKFAEDSVVAWGREEEPYHLQPNAEEAEFIAIDEDSRTLSIQPGTWELDRIWVLPAGYRVLASPGTELRIGPAGGLISYSPLEWKGSRENPIRVRGGKDGASGIAVIRADGLSTLEHVRFDGLSHLQQGGWSLSGGVTFFESEVDLRRVRFERIQSEDALNLVRSRFRMEGVEFVDSASDALDSDFSEGDIQQVSFSNSGNDGLDISGSRIQANRIVVRGSGDKGVSVGEASRIEIQNLDSEGARIGIAVKDRSQLMLHKARLVDSEIGIALYQKKPEYSGGKAEVGTLSAEGVEQMYLVEEGSSLLVGGNAIPGKYQKVSTLVLPPAERVAQ